MEFLEVPIFDDDVFKLLFRFVWNLVFLTLCVVLAIYPREKERQFVFTAVMMNIMVFFICFTLKKFELQLGMALGLFAIFGVLRYRTSSITTKEMSYLFVVIGIAVVNALSNKKTSYTELLAVNVLVLITAIVMERFDGGRRSLQFTMNYDKVKWLRPEFRQQLIADLTSKTGLEVTHVEIKTLGVKKSSSTILVTYLDRNLPPIAVQDVAEQDVDESGEASSEIAALDASVIDPSTDTATDTPTA